MNSVLFANYDFSSTRRTNPLSSPSFPSSQSRSPQENQNSNSPGPSIYNTPSQNITSVKSLFGSPSSANDSSFLSPGSLLGYTNATPSKVPSRTPPLPNIPSFSRPQRLLDKSNLGYLAFPTTGSPFAAAPSPVSEGSHTFHSSHPSSSSLPDETDPQPKLSPPLIDPLEEKHRARLEREEAEKIRGEEDWVRSGGILRDGEGKRDFSRTQKVREEIRLREWEKEVQERWDTYERRWAELQAQERNGDSAISFNDIPWPVHIGEKEDAAKTKRRISGSLDSTVSVALKVKLSDLTRENVEKFLMDGLKVRGCKVTRKERVRTSFLRWHPDKMMALVSKVVEDDRKDVEDGIGAVVRCLQNMNTKH